MAGLYRDSMIYEGAAHQAEDLASGLLLLKGLGIEIPVFLVEDRNVSRSKLHTASRARLCETMSFNNTF